MHGFYKTTDSGNTWISKVEEAWPEFLGIRIFFFVDEQNGWLSTIPGAGSYAILQTTDGGQTWKSLPEGLNIDSVISFHFISKKFGMGGWL